jgi:hypothetical protein
MTVKLMEWLVATMNSWPAFAHPTHYLMAITIESGPIKCSALAVVKPASFIQPMQSEAV